jgi:plasmid stabilization system protein ParE
MRVIWSPGALEDLARLRRFLAGVNPPAAIRAIKSIREGVKMLGTNPGMGRPVLDLNSEYRERLVVFGAGVYVVRYRVEDHAVVLLTVRHGREASP